MAFGGCAIHVLLALVTCSPAGPILSEVLYDAVGDDSDREFVELYNPHSARASLAGVRLEVGDGSGPGRWTARWTGVADDSIDSFGRFVVGGARVSPLPDRVVALDLQNGPDAVRLVWPDGSVEVLGYGSHEFPEYACGAPAPDVPSGQSLARIPDDSDQGDNAGDFRPAQPSPGRANQPRRDAAIVPASTGVDPEQPRENAVARVRCRITNHGASRWEAPEAHVSGLARGASGDSVGFEASLAVGLAPGDTIGFESEVPALPAGKQTLTLTVTLPGDEVPDNDRDSLAIRVGLGPLELTEIQFHPAHGEGEWVEVRNRDHDPIDPAAFTLGDRSGTRGTPRGGVSECPPESLLVLAQDPAALLGRYPLLESRRVWQVSPWPALNNSDGEGGTADAVVLRERDGTPCARVEYSASGVPAGVPIEPREDGHWEPGPDPDGSPLAPPRPLPPLAAHFELKPRRSRAGEPVELAWSLPWATARVAIGVYDLAGRHVAEALSETSVTRRGERAWRTGGIPAGLYVLVLEARAEVGETLTVTRVLRLDEGAR